MVKIQTALKNRIHNLLDRNHLKPPEKTNLFGAHGRAWMNRLSLKDPDHKLLKSDLDLLDTLRSHIRQTEKWVDEALKDNPYIELLKSLSGIGDLLAPLIALEIDTLERFGWEALLL